MTLTYAEPLWICISDIWQYNVHVIATLYFDCRIYVFELMFLHFTEILTQWRKTRLIVHICTLCTVKLVARCMYTLSSSVCLFSKDKSMYCIDLQTFSGFCLFWHFWKSWNFFLFFHVLKNCKSLENPGIDGWGWRRFMSLCSSTRGLIVKRKILEIGNIWGFNPFILPNVHGKTQT